MGSLGPSRPHRLGPFLSRRLTNTSVWLRADWIPYGYIVTRGQTETTRRLASQQETDYQEKREANLRLIPGL
jgi:hypothetical protein